MGVFTEMSQRFPVVASRSFFEIPKPSNGPLVPIYPDVHSVRTIRTLVNALESSLIARAYRLIELILLGGGSAKVELAIIQRALLRDVVHKARVSIWNIQNFAVHHYSALLIWADVLVSNCILLALTNVGIPSVLTDSFVIFWVYQGHESPGEKNETRLPAFDELGYFGRRGIFFVRPMTGEKFLRSPLIFSARRLGSSGKIGSLTATAAAESVRYDWAWGRHAGSFSCSGLAGC